MRLFSVSDELARSGGACVLLLHGNMVTGTEEVSETADSTCVLWALDISSPSSSSILSLTSPLSEPPPLTVDDATLPALAAIGLLQTQSKIGIESK